eukprot:g15933.t1
MRPPLKFHGSPAQMTAAALPMLGFCINRMSMNEHLGFFSFFIAIGLVMLGLCWGLGPAFFPRVDHPLHKLDRIRWSHGQKIRRHLGHFGSICGCICFLVLVVSSMVSDGAVHVFLRLRPHMQLSLEDFAEGKADGAGLVTLEAHLDLSRIGAAAHCSDCTASECAKKDCRAEAGLSPLSSEIPLLRIDDLDAYSDSSELFGRRLSGAGAGGGGGAMDEAVAQQLPERLKACDGQRAVPNSENWWSKCRSSGFINCRARSLAGKCCCHVLSSSRCWATKFLPDADLFLCTATAPLGGPSTSVAEVFSVDFQQIGLVFGGELLSPDLDFKTLGDLGIHDECTVSFVLSQVESTPRKERLAGHSEGNALAFFRRNRNVYKALDCPHLGQLRLARGTVANFGREYAKGWNCDGCERHFASGTQLYRCDFSPCHALSRGLAAGRRVFLPPTQAEAVSNYGQLKRQKGEARSSPDINHWPSLVQQAAAAAVSAQQAESTGAPDMRRGLSKSSLASNSEETHLTPFESVVLERRKARAARAERERERWQEPERGACAVVNGFEAALPKQDAETIDSARPPTPSYPSPFKEQPAPPPMPPEWSKGLWEQRKRELAEERRKREAERDHGSPPPVPPRVPRGGAPVHGTHRAHVPPEERAATVRVGTCGRAAPWHRDLEAKRWVTCPKGDP